MWSITSLVGLLSANDGLLLDPLKSVGEHSHRLLLQIVTTAQLSETSDDQVTNLTELGVARDQEHVSCNAIHEHLLASDAIVAESEEDPRHVCMNLGVVDGAQSVEEVHDALLKQKLDAVSGQGEVHQGKRAETLDADLLLRVHA